MSPQIVTADAVDRNSLNEFLREALSPVKGDFLKEHGAWWHRGDQNRLVLLVDGVIAGYCAVIPARIMINCSSVPVLWWVDLIIVPAYRGRGYQTLFDAKVREMSDHVLGFSNETAATIHKKHGWGVRNDLRVMLAPLRPMVMKKFRDTGGLKGIFLRASALCLSPLVYSWRANLRRCASLHQDVREIDNPSSELLEVMAKQHGKNSAITTDRNANHFQWRYLDAPYRADLRFYCIGPESSPSLGIIVRYLIVQGNLVARILDIFGDIGNIRGVKGILRRIIVDAIEKNVAQITSLVTKPELIRAFRSVGFIFSAPLHFCWNVHSHAKINGLAGDIHWTLGDSDNDDSQ